MTTTRCYGNHLKLKFSDKKKQEIFVLIQVAQNVSVVSKLSTIFYTVDFIENDFLNNLVRVADSPPPPQFI